MQYNYKHTYQNRHKAKSLMPDLSSMVRLEGIEPPTYSLGNWRSVRLSYRRMYTLLYRF